jgi:hypothetical protein
MLDNATVIKAYEVHIRKEMSAVEVFADQR